MEIKVGDIVYGKGTGEVYAVIGEDGKGLPYKDGWIECRKLGEIEGDVYIRAIDLGPAEVDAMLLRRYRERMGMDYRKDDIQTKGLLLPQ